MIVFQTTVNYTTNLIYYCEFFSVMMWLKSFLLSQVSVYRSLAVEIDLLDEQITITELHKSGRKRRDSSINF